MGAAAQACRRHGAEIRQQGRRTGLVLFKGGQQHGGGIAVVGGGRLCQLQGLFHLRGAGFVPGGSQHRADVAVEQFTVQGRRLFVHPLRDAVAGALLRRDRGHRKADAAAADGGQNACQRIRREQEQHALGRLLHDLQQGIGGLLVHALHMVEQDGAALGRQAGVENFTAHGRDLTHKVPPAAAHAGHRDGLAHDARLHLAAVALAGLCHSAAAFAPQKRFSGRAACGVKIIGGDAAGRKTGSQPVFAHKKHTVGQPPGRQHLPHARFQFCIAFHAVQHHKRVLLF